MEYNIFRVFIFLIFTLRIKSSEVSRIVGGAETTIEKYPSAVHIERTARTFESWSGLCGGSILTPSTILSAAHCFSDDEFDLYFYRIRAGSTTRGIGGTVVDIASRINHPLYTGINFDGDIALAFLVSRLEYSKTIQPCTIIAGVQQLPDDAVLMTVGWGRLSYAGVTPEVLQEVQTFTINRVLCRERYVWGGAATTVTDNMICNGILNVGGMGPCQGDSGGPVYYYGIVVGLVSWGWGCGDLWNPAVATAVSSYTDWIISNVA